MHGGSAVELNGANNVKKVKTEKGAKLSLIDDEENGSTTIGELVN